MCPANKSSCWIVMLQVQVSTKPRRKDVTLPIMLIYVELSKDFRKNARTPAAQIGVKRLQAPRCLFNASQPGCKDHFPKGRKWDPSMWHYEMTWQQLGIIWNNYGMNDDILALLGTLIRSNQIPCFKTRTDRSLIWVALDLWRMLHEMQMCTKCDMGSCNACSFWDWN